MTERRELDDALATATERVDGAQRELAAEPPASPDLVHKADRVERLAEDLHELATDATEQGPEGS